MECANWTVFIENEEYFHQKMFLLLTNDRIPRMIDVQNKILHSTQMLQ